MKGGENDKPEDDSGEEVEKRRQRWRVDTLDWFLSQPVDPEVVRELFGPTPPPLIEPEDVSIKSTLAVAFKSYANQLAAASEHDPPFLKLSDIGFPADCLPWILVRVPKVMELQGLWLANTKVTGDELKHLKDLRTLQTLGLTCTEVDGNGLKHLKDLPLQRLRLDGTQVDGNGLVHLQNLPLQALSLDDTQVDGNGLVHLQNLPLRWLSLYKTEVDGPGLVDFLDHQLTHPDRLDEAGKARLDYIVIQGCKRVLEDANGKRIVGMPEEVLGIRDPKELLAALKRYLPGGGAKGRIPIRQAKLVILGNGKVGKTHLRHRLTQPDKPLPVILSTPAWEADDWKPAGSGPLFRIFDFAGQVETHGAHRMFLASERNFYLIVIRADKSLEENRLDYWLRLIRTYGLRESSGRPGGTPPPITVLINHCDCKLHKDFAPLEEPAKLAQFKDQLKKDHKLGTLDVIFGHSDSAPDVHSYNRESLKGLQDTLSRQAEAHKDDLAALYHPKAETLLAWCGGDEEVMPDSVFGLVTTLERFDDFCTELGISESFDHRLCLHLAANLGYVVSVSGEVSKRAEHEASWRGSLEHVRERVYSMLKLRDAVYDLVRGEGLIVSRAQLGDSPGKSHKGVPLGDLLAIMTTFGLIFPVSTDEYLIVDRLPDTDSPHSVPAGYVPVNIDFNLTFLSEAHLPRLAGEMYARYIRYGGVDLASEMRRNRIVLAHATETDCRAILIAEVNAAKLHLYISKSGTEQQKTELIGDIRTKVEYILASDKKATTVREAKAAPVEETKQLDTGSLTFEQQRILLAIDAIAKGEIPAPSTAQPIEQSTKTSKRPASKNAKKPKLATDDLIAKTAEISPRAVSEHKLLLKSLGLVQPNPNGKGYVLTVSGKRCVAQLKRQAKREG